MITGAAFSRFVGQVVVTAEGESCFYCGNPTGDPAVVWSGFGGEIFLHPACCVELAIRVLRDVHAMECKAHLHLVLVQDADKAGADLQRGR